PEPSRRPPAPERSHQVQAPEPSSAPPVLEPPSAPQPPRPAPAPAPSRGALEPEPPSAPERSRRAPAPERSGGAAAPEPSWGTVLAPTVRLWAQHRRRRWWPTQTRWRLAVMAALAAVVFVTGGVTVGLAGSGRGEPTPSRASGGTPIGAGVLAAAQAAS